MIDVELDSEMEAPCLCDCGEWFDLDDGRQSPRFGCNTLMCEDCYHKQVQEKEIEDEIIDLENEIQDLESGLLWAKERLRQLQNNKI